MFDKVSTALTADLHRPATPYGFRMSMSVASVVVAALLTGCAQTDAVNVGAVPDDYRTNHPIVIAEKEQSIDLPVGASDRGMTKMQRVALGGFLSDYDRSASAPLTILVPTGSRNHSAASAAARDFAQFARSNGVPHGRIIISSYQAGGAETSAPVRVMYSAMQAQTNKCGRWTDDLTNTTENKHYTNYGCSYQNNLAQQIDNPADLLGPRKMTEIDAERRSVTIDEYRERPSDPLGEVDIDF